MKKQTFQHAEIRDENDNIVNNGAYGKNTALSNAQNDGWIDHVMNNLEYLYEHGTGGSNSTIAIVNADATIKVGGTTTLAPTERARVTNKGTDRQAVLYFEIPQGKQGKDGKQGEKGEKGEKGDPTATITLGKVTTIAPTEQARAVNVGTKNNLILDLYIPQGKQGEQGKQGIQGVQGEQGKTGNTGKAATIKLGTVTTLKPTEQARAENVGTDSEAVINLYIPQGKQGTLDGIDLTKYVVHDELKDLAKKESLVGLASTEYVDGRIKHVVGTAPEALDTLGEIATALTENKDKIGTLIGEISTKADKGIVENALMGKADKSEVEKALSTKADKGTVENALMGKADKNEIEKALTNKADKNDVYTKGETDSKFQPKGKYVKEEYLQQLETAWSDELDKKADKDDVEESLSGKVNKADVYTKDEIYTKNEADTRFAKKGEAGVKGDRGERGPQGPQGPQGPKGPAGSSADVFDYYDRLKFPNGAKIGVE